ncbi:excalibur calcium-binding domain-containing protein [Arthrobacter sp. QXT-31]|uniref:excalibur calcium-binding domain-containing protein n=1 Tax=Arthrobacter sp. QXT-31 TaxID=1357915 RepID=UPI00097183DD|nr:excalibur calcium-binding domain-containing protein [Arthrobacter sp. QXT-31]APX01184.1 calcium-binding protein [Arthrobacter sp. QXT-31]
MKKTLTLLALAGLMLTGCGGQQAEKQAAAQAAPQPAETATATATPEMAIVPGVISLTLDKATDQLEDFGFEVDSVDILDGKTIVLKQNWQVVSQEAAGGAQVAKGSTIHLGVKSLEKLAEEKAAADKAAADKAAAVKAAAAKKAAADKAAAAKKAAADKAAAAKKAAADKAAADKAAAAKKAAANAAAAKQAAEQAAAQQAPAQIAPVAPAAPPAAAYYPNCAAARAAGAAPLYSGQAGYSTSLDRDRDGVACE